MDKPLAFGQKTHDKTMFKTPTYDSPQEAFLASAMANSGVNWPRKNLSGKPKTGKSRGGRKGQSRVGKKKSYSFA
jgi:hypothetical protein